MGIRPEVTGRYLAVEYSSIALYSTLERTPIVRVDYRSDAHSEPVCHWQVHAERGALSHLLTLAGHDKPHTVASLRLPVGGARLRPGLEDFIQFLIDGCHVDSVDGWRVVVMEGRRRWRLRQIATVVRDVPNEAVRVLREMGYTITDPTAGPPQLRTASLEQW